MSNIVQIRKKTGLGDIKMKSGSSQTITPKLYNQEKKDRNEDGNFVEDWNTSMPGTKRGLCPMWAEIHNRWAFSGTAQDFKRLVELMSLKYQPGHQKEGQLITIDTANFEKHLRDFKDPVFQNPALYGQHFMTGGGIGLTKDIPSHEFLIMCMKGDMNVIDRASDKKISSYSSAASQLEMISPEKIVAAKNKDIKTNVKAMVLFSELDGSDVKIKIVCDVLDVPGYNSKTAANAAYNLLYERVVNNTNTSAKYGMSPQKRFVEVMSKTDEELNIEAQIVKGNKSGFLRKHSGYYMFQATKLDGLLNQVDLINYFKDPKNQDDYVKLMELLEDK